MISENINAQVFLDLIGLIQGVAVGVVLIVLNKRKYRSTFFVGLFLILFSLELATWISINLKISDSYPELFLLPFNFAWLLLPLFFVYTQKISIHSEKKIKYWLLIPGILSFLVQVFIFCLPFETKVVIEDSSWHAFIFWILGNFYSWIIGGWNLWLLHKHRIEVQNTYSYLALKELQWAKYFLIYLLAISIYGFFIAYIFPESYPDNTIFSVMDLVAIYWVSYFGISQRNILSVINKSPSFGNVQSESQEQDPSPQITTDKLSELMRRVTIYMKTTEAYISPELTIVDLAEGLQVHPKLVSTSINSIAKENFNTYVNRLRIERALDLIKTGNLEAFSMEGIGNEVGFKSKSSFYAAFKKVTGTTPIKYKERFAA